MQRLKKVLIQNKKSPWNDTRKSNVVPVQSKIQGDIVLLLSQRAENGLSSTEAIGKGDGDYRKGEEKENHITDLSTFPVSPGDSRFFLLSPGLPVFYDFLPVVSCLSAEVFL